MNMVHSLKCTLPVLFFRGVPKLMEAVRLKIRQGNGSIPAALGLYRYFSWFLTSVFYFLGPPPATYVFKLGVVISLFLAAAVSHQVYRSGRKSPGFLKTLVGLETLGIAFLLLPTGGLDSPFIWYAINPILVAAAELPFQWCWGILAGFALVATGLMTLTGASPAAAILNLTGHSYLLLTFTLVTLAAQILARLLKHSHHQALLLAQQRAELEQSLDLISSLYRLVEVVSTRDKVQEVLDLFAGYARALAGADKVVIWLGPVDEDGEGELWATVGPAGLYPREQWSEELPRIWRDRQREPGPLERVISPGPDQEVRALYLPVRSPNRCHGVLAAVYQGEGNNNSGKRHTLKFLADLCAVALERCWLGELTEQLVLVEEQNRIANEIHDGVAQHLFSIACGCHLLRENWEELEPELVRDQLDLIAHTAHRAARELRASIYRLSPRHRGKEVFIQRVKTYLEELAELNGVKVDLQVEGSEEVLSPALRKAFYRIIREATGNALRHGRCKSLVVRLQILPTGSLLEIEDDGCGYQPGTGVGQDKGRGLGIQNMKQLAATFDGELNIEGRPGRGTVVRCVVPTPERNLETPEEALIGEVGSY